MEKEMVVPTEELKEKLDREERVRQDHILLRKIYECVVNIQHDLDVERKIKKIEEMENQVEKLNKEIGYMREDLRHIQQHKWDMLSERY